jgi:FtsP/CotA-like multicopper oxidase with cupredoxin domain
MAGLGTDVKTHFALRARMGGSLVIDGAPSQVWFFKAEGGADQGFMGDRQVPSVHLETIEGELTQIDFFNQSPMDHTIHLHGLDVDTANDGVPQTSFVVPPGGSTTYEFIAPHAGTYHYHCHVDTVVHYARGMFGTVIVRPPDGSIDTAWEGGPHFDEEVLWHLHNIDTAWNTGPDVSGPTSARYHPDVFMLNGKFGPDALTDPFTRIDMSVGQTTYIRLTNTCYNWARVSLGGLLFQVVASDGRPMLAPVTTGSWEMAPGERYDLLLTPDRAGSYLAQVDYLDDYSSAVLGSARTAIEIS